MLDAWDVGWGNSGISETILGWDVSGIQGIPVLGAMLEVRGVGSKHGSSYILRTIIVKCSWIRMIQSENVSHGLKPLYLGQYFLEKPIHSTL